MYATTEGYAHVATPRILGHRWYGQRTQFPGFNYKKKPAMGPKICRNYPGSGSLSEKQTFDNVYTSGSGVGATSVALRRAKFRGATASNVCYGRYTPK